MQINKLALKNFKGVESVDFSPSKFNVLIGPNGTGKTTILEAVKCGINGKTPADHVKAGELGASINLDIDNVGVVERKWAGGKSSTRLNGKTTTQKSITEMIQAQLGFTPTTTNIMSSSEVVENMFGKDFSAYLLDFLRNDMDFDKLVALCDMSDDAANELAMQLPAAPDIITLEDIEDAHAYYRDARTTIKSEPNQLQARAQYEGVIPTRSLADVDNEVQTINREIGSLTTEKKNYEANNRLYEQTARQITDLEARIAGIKAKKPTGTEIKAVEDLIFVSQKSVTHCSGEITKWQSELVRLREILIRLGTSVCPISKKLVCTTDKTSIKSELEAYIKTVETSVTESVKTRDTTEKELALAIEHQKVLTRDSADYELKETLVKQLEGLKKVKLEKPKEPDSGLISKKTLHLKELEKEREIIARYNDSEEAKKKAVLVAARLAVYEELVTLLSPKGGARKKVLEHHIAPLQMYCNTKMEKILPKYSMSMDISNGFNIMLADEFGNMISYDALSNGEKIRILYILTDMLNALNNFKILILDNLDGLDEESLMALVEVIMENKDDYDHIFLASVNSTEAKKAFGLFPKADTNEISLSA